MARLHWFNCPKCGGPLELPSLDISMSVSFKCKNWRFCGWRKTELAQIRTIVHFQNSRIKRAS